MSEILLCTLNSTYQHSSFGLRYLFANLHELQKHSKILEFTITQKSRDIVEKILLQNPLIVGFGVYIWNTTETQEVISILKRIKPELTIIVGGPEVSFESETQKICEIADFVIKGESDFLFYELTKKIFYKQDNIPQEKFLSGPLPEVEKILSPYQYYTNDDIKNRVIYVEASRGCPYKCEYCLSSLDKTVRNFPLESFLSELHALIDRGARQFKFVDRTFNLSPAFSTKILQFFLDRINLGLFLHFELVPDRLPLELKNLIEQFPAGSLQFEIGIQTWNPTVSALVSRRQNYEKIKENFFYLKEKTKVHTHADLIVGLPGESLDSFAKGFDALAELEPHEIQVGILKRLKGTPIIRHNNTWQMIYQEHPPFQVLSTKTMDYLTLQQMNRFAKFWDLIANSGNFPHTLKLFRKISLENKSASLFWLFYQCSNFLAKRHEVSHGIALLRLTESIWIYLIEELKIEKNIAQEALIQDYACGYKKRDLPNFLSSPNEKNFGKKNATPSNSSPQRQSRHNAIHCYL